MGGGGGSDGDFVLYFGLAGLMLILTILTFWFTNKKSRGESQNEGPPVAQGNRRQAGVRNRRNRRMVEESESEGERGGAAGGGGRGSDGSDRDMDVDERLNDPKLGAKKRAKLEAKAEKRANREAEERMREERKARQAKEENERQVREQQEADAEKKKEEEEKRLKEEQAQKELDEYNEMKKMFAVEEEGCDVIAEEEEGNLLEKFLDHIKAHKVVMFDELASKFGLKVPDAIDRLKLLVEDGRLTGVMDDRGKFIYISQTELEKFAKFIKQRGRVGIAELVENSSSLINLTPVETES